MCFRNQVICFYETWWEDRATGKEFIAMFI